MIACRKMVEVFLLEFVLIWALPDEPSDWNKNPLKTAIDEKLQELISQERKTIFYHLVITDTYVRIYSFV